MSSFYLIVKRGETSLRLGYSAQQVHIIITTKLEFKRRKDAMKFQVGVFYGPAVAPIYETKGERPKYAHCTTCRADFSETWWQVRDCVAQATAKGQ